MKSVVIAGLLAVALAGTAAASERPGFSWTGCYVGGHAGAIKNANDLKNYAYGPGFSAAATAATTYSYDGDGTSFTGGVQYGCNYQKGNWVIGLDSSFSWAGIDQTFNAFHPAGVVLAYTETVSQQVDWYSTTRARLGWAHDRWMVFVAGGLATGRVESAFLADFISSGGANNWSGSRSKNRYGWTIGGGLEYALSQNWFLRGEYLYVDLGSFSYTSYPAPASPGQFWSTDVDTKFHVARVALSYRFTRAPSLLNWAMDGFKY